MPQPSKESITIAPHEVRRLTVEVPGSFGEFRASYERAVPTFEAGRFQDLMDREADWRTIEQATKENAPHGFIIYWSTDIGALMHLAGDRSRGVEYLMGNHVLAQRMYHHDAAISLYAPLRSAIYEDADGAAWFTIDQPSTCFSSFDNAEIAAVGYELDHELAALLDHLGAPVPETLTDSS